MDQVFATQLDFKIWKINVETQKINGTTLNTYILIVSSFSVLDKDDKERFFKKATYLLMSSQM